MQEQAMQRLRELRMEFESGRKMLAEFDEKQKNIRTTLLRISGAIQVLEELLAGEPDPGSREHCAPLHGGSEATM